MNVCAIIAGGGRGRRMGTSVSKQFLKISEKPIIAHTLEKFVNCGLIKNILIVVPPELIEFVNDQIIKKYRIEKIQQIVAGGANRQESIFNALKVVHEKTDLVAIHDAVRPFIKVSQIEQLLEKGGKVGAVILAVRVQDTIKSVSNGIIKKTLHRDALWRVQTPQVFRKDLILEAYRTAEKQKFIATDDAALVERIGHPVHVLEGDELNIKITRPGDLEFAKFIYNQGYIG